MSTTELGRAAEAAAAEQLEKQGFEIIARNWRNRWCEIDIAARRGDELHLIEVKYRQHRSFGGGFGAINAEKVRRLQRAALAFNRGDEPVLIDIVAVSGQPGQWQFELLENAIGVS
jgi:putative endonuclease